MASIFPSTKQYQETVTILTDEYIMSSMAMFIFSATLTIHASCAFQSVKLLLRNPTRVIFILNTIQAFFAVTCHLSAVSGYYFITHCHFKGFFNWIFYYASNTTMELLVFMRLFNDEKISAGFLVLGCLLELAKLVIIIILENGITAYNGKLQQCVIAPHMPSFLSYMTAELIIYIVQFCGIAYIVYNRYTRSPTKSLKNALSTNALGLTMASSFNGIFWFSLLLGGVTFHLNPDVLFQTKWAVSSKLFSLQLQKIERLRYASLLPQSKISSGGDFESEDCYNLKNISSSKLNQFDY